MRHRVLLLLLPAAALAGGAVAGGLVQRASAARVTLPPRIARPAPLEAAWAAFETGRAEDLRSALERLPADAGAEGDLLRAAASGDATALGEVARRHAGTSAGALAEILLAEREADPAARERRRRAFASRYPRSWWNAAGVPGGER